jgi:predicted RecA/RadA family phage recombinase
MIRNFREEAPHIEIVNAAIPVNEVTSGPLTQADQAESISIGSTETFSSEQVLEIFKRNKSKCNDILLGDLLE